MGFKSKHSGSRNQALSILHSFPDSSTGDGTLDFTHARQSALPLHTQPCSHMLAVRILSSNHDPEDDMELCGAALYDGSVESSCQFTVLYEDTQARASQERNELCWISKVLMLLIALTITQEVLLFMCFHDEGPFRK